MSVKRHGSMTSRSERSGGGGCVSQQQQQQQMSSEDLLVTTTTTPGHQHVVHHHHHGHHHGHQQHVDPDWEAKEELRLRELEEARTRAAQMEKTMRWWSDCTANWREKWSKVRTERNKVREEVRFLRTKLEAATKENSGLRRERQELEVELEGLRSSGTSPCLHIPERDVVQPEKAAVTATTPTGDPKGNLLLLRTATHPSPDMEFFDHIFQQSSSSTEALQLDLDHLHLAERDGRSRMWDATATSVALLAPPPPSSSSASTFDVELVEQKVTALQMRLDESAKTVQAEREEKSSLNRSLDRLQQDYTDMKLKYEKLKVSKQEALKELSQAKAEHQDEMNSIRLDLEDEACSRSSMDRRLADLRAQLERLQAENAAEWGKRERLETEKLALERENKKLRTQIADLDERLERKAKNCGGSGSGGGEPDVKALQHELHDKNKELSDMRHAHGKLKKVLQDKTTELAHALRRAEQYEAEVKKLRCRVEELKKELAIAEDEIDCSANNIRKLQRSNDELQEQVDSLQVQVDHLQTRLRNNSHSLLALRGSNSLLNDGLSEDDNAEY